ncbi:MAG: hypothetical protein EA351_06415, partial [Gemmatimonadales bacterium]
MASSSETRIPSTELTRVLTVASELQRQSEGAREESFSLAELEAAAREAGIDPRFVRAASRALVEEREAKGDGLLGPDATWTAEESVRGTISDDDAHRLLSRLQTAVPISGGSVDSPADGVWRLADGGRATVQITRMGDEVILAVVSDRKGLKAGLLGGGVATGVVVGFQLAAAAVFTLPMEMFDIFPLIATGGGVAGGLAGGATG